MNTLITGIHHVTAIASDAQKNIDFYTRILGLRLVKKTVNFDAPGVYHFYYGDRVGKPGSILTFFPYSGLVKGRHGKGHLNTTTFSVAFNSLNFWLQRLSDFGIAYKEPQERYPGEVVVYLEDPDGLGLELIFNDKDQRTGFDHHNIPEPHRIKGIYSVEIWLDSVEKTGSVLTQFLDHRLLIEKGNRFRYATADRPGHYVDLICTPESQRGRNGSGTVHHIAFSTPDKQSQLAVLEKLQRSFEPTEVKDRKYFSSIYFREPGGVLFEVATADPGFTIDESEEHLGENLMLPGWLDSRRGELLEKLPTIITNY